MNEEIEPRSCSNCGRSEIKGSLTNGFFRECELQDEKIHTTYVPEDFFCNYWIPRKENPEKQRKKYPCGGTPEIRRYDVKAWPWELDKEGNPLK